MTIKSFQNGEDFILLQAAHQKSSVNMAKSKITPSFKDAVRNCREISDALKPGLSAMKANSKKVRFTNSQLIDGSVDIDEAVRGIRPDESRWDYVIGYSNEAIFIEVHPADTANVDEMVKKVKWLKSWLTVAAPDLKGLHKREVYYWIPSGRVNILKGSVQYRKIAVNHLLIKNPVILS